MTRFGDALRGTASPDSSPGSSSGSEPRHGARWTPRHRSTGDGARHSARHASSDDGSERGRHSSGGRHYSETESGGRHSTGRHSSDPEPPQLNGNHAAAPPRVNGFPQLPSAATRLNGSAASQLNGQRANAAPAPDARPLNGNWPRHAPVGPGLYAPSGAWPRRAPASGPAGRVPLNWVPVDAIDGPTQKLPTIPAPRPGTGSQPAVPTTRPQVQPEPGQEETQTEWLPRATLRRRRRRAKRRRILEWPVLVGLALLVALVVRTFVLQSFYIPSGSMFDTLKINNRVVVNKISYHLHAVHRGDVVVFNRPKNVNISDKDLIKRVIGLPGDVLSAHGGSVYVGSRRLSEPYVKKSCHGTADFGPVTVPKHDIFVMGDNRCDSYDSRYFGAIPQSLIVGRAFLLIWPLSRFGAL